MNKAIIYILLISYLIFVSPRAEAFIYSNPITGKDQLVCCLNPGSDTNSISPALRHQFSVSSGYARHIERDDAISPFIYRGGTMPLEINYSFQRRKNRLAFSFFFDKLTLGSDLTDFAGNGPQYSTANTNIAMQGSYSRKVISIPGQKLDFFFGGGVNLLLNYRLHSTVASNSNFNYTMLDQFNSLALFFQAEKRFHSGDRFLSACINIPAISYVLPGNTYNAYVGEAINSLMNSESNILIELVKNGELASFGKLVNVNADLSYSTFAGRHFGFIVKYGFYYYRYTQFPGLNFSKNLRYCFLVGLTFRI